MSATTSILIRRAHSSEAERLQQSYTKIGWTKPDGYFADCCRLQEVGKLVLLVAECNGDYVGHCKIIWEAHNPYFKQHQIPETQDLNVLGEYRRQGVATALMDEAERLIGQRGDIAGISFGLYADYGPAQRMYILRGYVPDGMGACHRDVYVTPGKSYPIDDEFTLGLIKTLR